MPQLYFIDREDFLIFINCVFVSAQEALRSQLLKIYHDCSSGDHWGWNKILDLICRHFTWPGITKDVKKYIATCPVYQEKVIYWHKLYSTLEFLLIEPDVHLFKEISLD